MDTHDRAYMQTHLREEIARARRYGHQFGLLIFEAIPSSDGIPLHGKIAAGLEALQSAARACDVAARVYDDAIALLLVETDAHGARDALFRMRNMLARTAGAWRVTLYHFPEHSRSIEALPLLTAA